MSFLDGLLGSGASASILGISNAQQRSYDDALDVSRSAQIQAQYTQAQMNRFNTHKWVFNGQPCSLQQFADSVWGSEDHPDKMLFLLTHSGPAVAESSR